MARASECLPVLVGCQPGRLSPRVRACVAYLARVSLLHRASRLVRWLALAHCPCSVPLERARRGHRATERADVGLCMGLAGRQALERDMARFVRPCGMGGRTGAGPPGVCPLQPRNPARLGIAAEIVPPSASRTYELPGAPHLAPLCKCDASHMESGGIKQASRPVLVSVSTS